MVMPGPQKAPADKIKVLHLLHTYLPEVSGVALNTYAILKELSRDARIESVVLVPFPKKCADEGYDIPHKIIRYRGLPFKRFLSAPALLLHLLAAYRKERFHILHCHGPEQIYVGSLFKKIIPSVRTIGMFRNDRMFKGRASKVRRLRAGLRGMEKIVSISPIISKMLLEENRDLGEKIADIPLGIDLDLYRGVEASDPGEPYIIYLGRLVGGKRVDVLLRAFARVRQHVPALCLYVLGDGSQRMQLQALAADLGIDGAVRFKGFMTGARKISLLKGAELLAFPSDSGEGFPGVLLEAFACDKIVIANDYAAAKVLIRHGQTGFIYDRNDPERLAAAIRNVLENREAITQQIIPAVRLEIANYAVEKVAEAYRVLYEGLMAGGAQGHR
jgi:glycosyltransferase involved in cell wall biosynthesis